MSTEELCEMCNFFPSRLRVAGRRMCRICYNKMTDNGKYKDSLNPDEKPIFKRANEVSGDT